MSRALVRDSVLTRSPAHPAFVCFSFRLTGGIFIVLNTKTCLMKSSVLQAASGAKKIKRHIRDGSCCTGGTTSLLKHNYTCLAVSTRMRIKADGGEGAFGGWAAHAARISSSK